MFKKVISYIFVLNIIFLVFAPSISAVTVNENDGNFTNLIVFAKFSDEDEFVDDNYGETVRKITDNSYNTAEYNVSDYFYSVSGGKVKMKSVYLFDNGGSITLSRKRAFYASYSDENPEGYTDSGERSRRMYLLKEDWAQAVNRAIKNGITDYSGNLKYDLSELDKNNDGYIDLITIIYKPTLQTNISVEWASPLWNYQDQNALVEFNYNGKFVHSKNYVQMTKSYDFLYTDINGKKITAIGVNCHETAHGFGLYDLYQSSYQPIGYMSAMGKHTTDVAQFISAKEREALGWIDNRNIYNILNEGTYKLKTVRDEKQDGVIAYKMDIPEMNKVLYLEYRKFDGKGSKYDSQKKDLYHANGDKVKGLSLKSGLVCYLVTKEIKFPNNTQSSVNNWNYSVIGGQYNNKPDAALSLGEGLEITDDIYIEVTDMTDDDITFSVEGNFKNYPTVAGVEITEAIDTVYPGKSYLLKAAVNGTNNPPQTVIWSVENSNDAKTFIDTDGNLYIGRNETSNFITVSASYENKFFDKKVISVSPEIHDLEYVKEVKATCETDGNFEHYRCKKCGKYFVDMGGTFEETTLENMTVKSTGHIAGNWIITKTPTPEENGEMERRCVGCNKVMEKQEVSYYPPSNGDIHSLFNSIREAFKRFFDFIRKILTGR